MEMAKNYRMKFPDEPRRMRISGRKTGRTQIPDGNGQKAPDTIRNHIANMKNFRKTKKLADLKMHTDVCSINTSAFNLSKLINTIRTQMHALVCR